MTQTAPTNSTPSVWPLSAAMKREMLKGVAYNMKVVLKGAPGVGKTSLLSRLCGHPLPTEYVPATTLTAGTIRICGSKCRPHEGTKVDIWDVPDRHAAKGRREAAAAEPAVPDASSSFLSSDAKALTEAAWDEFYEGVYKECSCALLMVDPSLPDSLDFATREVQRIPAETHVIFIVNHRESISSEDDAAWAAKLERVRALSRPTASPFMSHLFRGSPVPSGFSAPSAVVNVNVASGEGIQKVVWGLDVPNFFTIIRYLEAQLQRVYESMAASLPAATRWQPVQGSDTPASTPPQAQSRRASAVEDEFYTLDHPNASRRGSTRATRIAFAATKPRETEDHVLVAAKFHEGDERDLRSSDSFFVGSSSTSSSPADAPEEVPSSQSSITSCCSDAPPPPMPPLADSLDPNTIAALTADMKNALQSA